LLGFAFGISEDFWIPCGVCWCYIIQDHLGLGCRLGYHCSLRYSARPVSAAAKFE
jgi:hypothetical protein